jgi:hypothetical protein
VNGINMVCSVPHIIGIAWLTGSLTPALTVDPVEQRRNRNPCVGADFSGKYHQSLG